MALYSYGLRDNLLVLGATELGGVLSESDSRSNAGRARLFFFIFLTTSERRYESPTGPRQVGNASKVARNGPFFSKYLGARRRRGPRTRTDLKAITT